MKIAYVGDIVNHGSSLQVSGMSITILLALLRDVESIDVICPKENQFTEELELPSKVKLREFYKYDDSKSILRLLKIPWGNYDTVIFNMLPTGFGNGSISNAIALFIPILLKKYFRKNNIRVVYHNSVFTNDVSMLGYNSAFDKVRSFFLGLVEKILFKNLDTFVLLDLYKERIDKSIRKNKVRVLKFRYIESVPTIYLNGKMTLECLNVEKASTPIVLMHGFWGPQKNFELGLSALKYLKEQGSKFKLVISGGINHHFPDYERKFNELLNSYSDIIDEYLGPVSEADIMNIFLNANLLLLPYNAPGGLSGVLEHAIFFEVPTVAIDFPEYREQAKGIGFVRLIDSNVNIKLNAKDLLMGPNRNSSIKIREKIEKAVRNLQELIW